MSYALPPQTTKAGVPGVADDSTKGFVVGSAIIDTSVAPRAVYICADNAAGAAVWVNAGGITTHTGLTTLGWSAAGHTGTDNSVACFGAGGASQTVQATVEGSVLGFVGGVLTFTVIASTAAVLANIDRTLEIEYVNPNLITLDSAALGAGSII